MYKRFVANYCCESFFVMQQDLPKKLTTSEMAELLRRSYKQFRADVVKYNIPHIKIGGTRLFNFKEVEDFLKVKNSNSILPSPKVQNKKKNSKDLKTAGENTKKTHYQTLLGLR